MSDNGVRSNGPTQPERDDVITVSVRLASGRVVSVGYQVIPEAEAWAALREQYVGYLQWSQVDAQLEQEQQPEPGGAASQSS